MDLVRALAELLPKATVSDTAPDRLAYARDLWPKHLVRIQAGLLPESRPLAVVWPRSTEDVVALVGFARREGIKLVPFGAGSGVCGAILPDERTVVVDLKQMGGYEIEREAPLLDVGPGALGLTLEDAIQREGFTIGHFPSSILCSTVGGWVAARGAGQCSGRYGKIEDMVAELECVLGSGEVVRLKRRFSGPNLLPLFIGSEGTLGFITRAKLRLHQAPETRAFSAFSFPDLRAGCEALRVMFQRGLRPAVSRLYDPLDSVLLKQGRVKGEKHGERRTRSALMRHLMSGTMKGALRVAPALQAAIELAERKQWLGGATLILVFDGALDDVFADQERARRICRELEAADLGEAPARRWFEHRYSVSYRQSPVFRLGAFSDTMEVAAPWSKLQAVYEAVRDALGEYVLVLAHLSHAYPDGCSIYFTFSGVEHGDVGALYDRAWQAALKAAIESGATLSHHHGVGRSKAPMLGGELGLGVELVRRVMQACDPDSILNPGALRPRAETEVPFVDEQAATKQLPFEIDAVSGLVTAPGTMLVTAVETELARRGFSLGLSGAVPEVTVSDWLLSGFPGARNPWDDPVASTLSGLKARVHSGEILNIRSAPRRAVGPDLTALFVGAGDRVGTIEQATLSIVERAAPRSRTLPFAGEREPAPSDEECGLFERCANSVLAKP